MGGNHALRSRRGSAAGAGRNASAAVGRPRHAAGRRRHDASVRCARALLRVGREPVRRPLFGTLGTGSGAPRGTSAREYLQSLSLVPASRDAVDAMVTTIASAPLDRIAPSELMRIFALSAFDPVQMFAAWSSLKLATGTRSLIDAIAAQAKLADIRLRSPVRRVVQHADGVRVELVDGTEVAARTVLVTLPVNVLGTVAFEPGLSELKRAASEERHAGSGVKCYVHVKGDAGNLGVFAPAAEAVNWVATHHHGARGSLLMVFGNDASRLPLNDVVGIQAALRRLVPGAEVDSIFGWDWAADPYSLGTWCVLRPGQPARFLPELRRSEGRCFFASSDSAVGWRGFRLHSSTRTPAKSSARRTEAVSERARRTSKTLTAVDGATPSLHRNSAQRCSRKSAWNLPCPWARFSTAFRWPSSRRRRWRTRQNRTAGSALCNDDARAARLAAVRGGRAPVCRRRGLYRSATPWCRQRCRARPPDQGPLGASTLKNQMSFGGSAGGGPSVAPKYPAANSSICALSAPTNVESVTRSRYTG